MRDRRIELLASSMSTTRSTTELTAQKIKKVYSRENNRGLPTLDPKQRMEWYVINFGGHYEIILRKAADGVGGQVNPYLIIGYQNVGVVAFFLGKHSDIE